jgi:hypothetical protein
MAICQFLNMSGFSEAIAGYQILSQYARLWAVAFMVAGAIGGLGLIAGAHNPRVYGSSANLAFVVFVGWFLFGLSALSRGIVVNNTGFFGIYFMQPLSVATQVEVVILALAALFLAVQGQFFSHRGTMY